MYTHTHMSSLVGPTAYVLTHTPGEVREGGGGGEGVGYWLWNASTGKHSSQYDPHCPLISVGCIIGKENVSCIYPILCIYIMYLYIPHT